MATRRTALATLAAGSAAVALGEVLPTHSAHEAGPGNTVEKTERKPVYFEGRDYETLTRLTDLILPRTDTPGASDVGVPWRIDQAVSRKKELQPLYRNGLAHLNAAAKEQGKADFLALTGEEQAAILTKMCEPPGTPQEQFVQSVKALTIEWYYNTEPGLGQELGFKGNTYRTEFLGCTHPEHWPAPAAEKA
jgi:hypothetical protein